MECDKCGAVDPVQHVAQDRARLMAKREGWLLKQPHGHLCPKCAEPVKAEIAEKEAQEIARKKSLTAERDRDLLARLARFDAALDMRAAGKTLKEIGDYFGVSASQAKYILDKAERHEIAKRRTF